jgi:endoglucanase
MQQPQLFLAIVLFGLNACTRAATVAPEQSQVSGGVASRAAQYNAHILVDQFGYRPGDPKVAVIRDPHVGYDAKDSFVPGLDYQVRRSSDGAVVYSGKAAMWNGGSVQASSGDAGWWFDFSAVTEPGTYFVYDVTKKVRSPTFSIDQQVYRKILKAALRMYFYQRSGFAKRAPFAEACWVDDPAYNGPKQDTEAHDVTDQNNAAKIMDLGGGWFDAGDTNKYVTFAAQPVHQLLSAYQENPAAFTDDFNIPESGNGIPDVLDEVKWETDWLKKVQLKDGSAVLKVGEIGYFNASPPSSDHNARFYVPSCTSSTIALSGMLAHASYVYAKFPALAADAADLKTRAINAWNNYQGIANKQAHCDTGVVHAGNADWSADDQEAEAVVAAIYLYSLTNDAAYERYIKANYRKTHPYGDFGWSRYKPEQGDALLFYAGLPDADSGLKATILSDKVHDVNAGNQIYGLNAKDDLYRSFLHDPQYHWGSNNPRASYGNTNMDVLAYRLPVSGTAAYQDRALDVLHYFHGVNPFGKVYLSNMYEYGATNSVNEIFHAWFAAGSKWSDALSSDCGPAPGYVPGGPVANAASAGIPASISPPAGQPEQKSYRDWNGNYPESSYVVNEPAIYYQSAYLKLLSKFAN